MDTAKSSPVKPRLQSLDILRGFVILVMFFVNDVAGVTGAPAWMKHLEPSNADGMTFVDIVFPAFLFLVGMSIPFALNSRLERGTAPREIGMHILTRTASLLLIGVLMVNGETIAKNGPLSPALWGLVTHIGIVLTWLVLPGARKITFVLRLLGAALLVAAAILYRGNDATGFIQLRPQWWGILGLIGWAYLVAATIYVFLRKNLAGIFGAIALLYCVALADAVGGLPGLAWLSQWVSVGTMLGSLAAVTVSGAALGIVLAPGSSTEVTTHAVRVRWAFFYGLALAGAGFLLHTAHDLNGVFTYNKNAATLPWCLVSSAVTTWLWIVAYAVGDIRPQRWALVLVPTGQNALLAYVLAPLLYFILESLIAAGMSPWYYSIGDSFGRGVCRAVAFSVLVLSLAGALQRRGIYLKL